MSRLHWGWFVVLSVIGGILFALPMVLLWSGGANVSQARDGAPSGR